MKNWLSNNTTYFGIARNHEADESVDYWLPRYFMIQSSEASISLHRFYQVHRLYPMIQEYVDQRGKNLSHRNRRAGSQGGPPWRFKTRRVIGMPSLRTGSICCAAAANRAFCFRMDMTNETLLVLAVIQLKNGQISLNRVPRWPLHLLVCGSTKCIVFLGIKLRINFYLVDRA